MVPDILILYHTEADMRREMDRKEQERKKNQKVEFLSAGPQPGIVGGANKVNLPVPGLRATFIELF